MSDAIKWEYQLKDSKLQMTRDVILEHLRQHEGIENGLSYDKLVNDVIEKLKKTDPMSPEIARRYVVEAIISLCNSDMIKCSNSNVTGNLYIFLVSEQEKAEGTHHRDGSLAEVDRRESVLTRLQTVEAYFRDVIHTKCNDLWLEDLHHSLSDAVEAMFDRLRNPEGDLLSPEEKRRNLFARR